MAGAGGGVQPREWEGQEESQPHEEKCIEQGRQETAWGAVRRIRGDKERPQARGRGEREAKGRARSGSCPTAAAPPTAVCRIPKALPGLRVNDNRLPTSPHPPSADYFGTGVRGTGEGRGRGGASKCHSTLGSAQRAGTLLTNAGTDLKLSNPQAGTLLPRPKWTFQTGQPTDPGAGSAHSQPRFPHL